MMVRACLALAMAFSLHAAAQPLYLITSGVNPDELHLTAANKAAAEQAQKDGDTVVLADLAAHKRTFLVNRPKGFFQGVNVSSDGAHVVCFGRPKESGKGEAMAVVLSPAGAPEHRISFAHELPYHVATAPTMLPGNQRLGFGIYRMTNEKDPVYGTRAYTHEIVTTDLEGHDLKTIGKGTLPAWSPDGRTIAFTTWPVRNTKGEATTPCRLMLMNADGSNVRPAGPPESCDGSFSPDGKRLVYLQLGRDETDVMVANADGSSPQKVNKVRGVFECPRFVDNEHVVVFSWPKWMDGAITEGPKPREPVKSEPSLPGDDDQGALYVMSLDGSSVRRPFPRPGLVHFVDRTHHGVLSKYGSEAHDEDGNPIRPKAPPVVHDGTNLVFKGPENKAYIKEPSGRLNPADDGTYRLPSGEQVVVFSGRKYPRQK